jgi:hypothetical protein
MRFCPYCSGDNDDQAVACQRCGHRLLPLPPSRQASQGAQSATVSLRAGAAGAADGVATSAAGDASSAEAPDPGGDAMPAPAPEAASMTTASAMTEGPGQVRGRRTAPMPAPATGPLREYLEEALSQRPEGTPSEPDPGAVALDLPEPTLAPPPTRQVAPPAGAAPAGLPVLDPLPEPPDGGLWASTRYTVGFARGVLQRRAAVRKLHDQIRGDTTALDGLLGALGRAVRALHLNNRTLAAENQAIDEAETRRVQAETDSDDLSRRLADENQRFAEQEQDREHKLSEVEAALDKADAELEALEAQRRSLRDKRKTIERQQRAYLKTAEDRETEAGKAAVEDDRAQLRRSAEDLRGEAAALDPERQDLDRRLAALEKPVSQAAARVEALRGEQESIRRALRDLREGHRHRLSELEAEQGRKGREATTAEAEIGRRLVTLGTLLNLNRVERPEFDDLYARIDQLRSAIGARTNEIDRLIAERSAYDRGALIRGIALMLVVILALAATAVLAFALV